MNLIKEVKSARIGDHYYEVQHPSGLKILVYPKNDNNSTYAVFGTRYGSVDMAFHLKGEQEVHRVPAGIAHYLEHKLFESEDGDAFARYAKTGAAANAYTSFNNTCYLFSTTDQVYESLEILLDFVQSPFFTEQTLSLIHISSLSITEISNGLDRAVVGMHFFNPAPVMKLIEVIAGETTCPETVQKIVEISEQIGKTPVQVNEAAGFVVNRILIPMINEEMCIRDRRQILNRLFSCPFLQKLTPVSYTHLDVYKRQGPRRACGFNPT